MRGRHSEAGGRRRRHPITHRRRGIARRFTRLLTAGRSTTAAGLAIVGPGLIAGLSDDDPAGITTYSVLGAEHGYRLLWIIPLATVLLVHFHLVAVRIGAATGKGFVAIVRERWGRMAASFAVVALLFANFGTICAEYAGIAAAASLVGIPPWASAPLAGLLGASLFAAAVVLSLHVVALQLPALGSSWLVGRA